MTIARVGVREFRAGLAHHIEGDDPVAVTRHGHTVGYFIPVRTDREADLAALRAAAAMGARNATVRGAETLARVLRGSLVTP